MLYVLACVCAFNEGTSGGAYCVCVCARLMRGKPVVASEKRASVRSLGCGKGCVR